MIVSAGKDKYIKTWRLSDIFSGKIIPDFYDFWCFFWVFGDTCGQNQNQNQPKEKEKEPAVTEAPCPIVCCREISPP